MKIRESDEQPVVFVVDDDQSLCAALKKLFNMVGLRAETFSAAADFLKIALPDVPACLVLDIRLPGLSGLDVQSQLAKADIKIPIIFMTGYGDIPMTVQAMRAGAVEFLPKPFREQDMLNAVHLALERDRIRLQAERANAQLRTKFESLTARELEVMTLVTEGLMNKQIAARLGVAEVTVKLHRGSLMRKMDARSVAELARMAQILGIARQSPEPILMDGNVYLWMVTSPALRCISTKHLTALSLCIVADRGIDLPRIDVAVVEDDDSVREATKHLLRLLGYATAGFASAEEFLTSGRVGDTACLIADVQLPGMSGVELQSRLISDGHRMPVIFVTAFPEEAIRTRVLRDGALCYLTKPLREQALIACLERALDRPLQDLG